MRVLWVTAETPDRSLGGGNIREAHLLEAIARSHQTDLLLAGELHDDITRAVLHHVREIPVDAPTTPAKWVRRTHNLRITLGPEGPTERFANRAARRVLRPHLDESGYEVVVVQHAGLAPLLPGRRGARWVCELHNIASETAATLARLTPGRRQRWVHRRDAARARQLERWIATSYDAVIAVSEDDAALLPGPSMVVPNGVAVPPEVSAVPSAHEVLFVGTLSYLPNVDGLLWFAAEVWPRVRAAVPDATFTVVGRTPAAELAPIYGQPGVTVHADVPTVAPFLERARVCVVPLRAGSGTRLKAVEALAAGRPLVGTTVGLAGLGLQAGVHAQIADAPDALAEALVTVLTDDAAAAALAVAGREMAVNRYDWSIIGRTYADWLAKLS